MNRRGSPTGAADRRAAPNGPAPLPLLGDVADGALEVGLRCLTVYAFSTENWRRPADEVRFLMNFNETLLSRRRDELHERGVRVRFAGRRDRRVPRRVL